MTEKSKIELIKLGVCQYCGQTFQRPYACTDAVCTCRNPDPACVPLSPAISMPKSQYAKFSQISKVSGVDVERLINACLTEAARQQLQASKPTPLLVVTTKR